MFTVTQEVCAHCGRLLVLSKPWKGGLRKARRTAILCPDEYTMVREVVVRAALPTIGSDGQPGPDIELARWSSVPLGCGGFTEPLTGLALKNGRKRNRIGVKLPKYRISDPFR